MSCGELKGMDWWGSWCWLDVERLVNKRAGKRQRIGTK